MKITTNSVRGEDWECETCGWHNDETYLVYLDDDLVYKYFTDNHLSSTHWPNTKYEMWGHLLLAIEKKLKEGVEKKFTEQGRIDWNIKAPGNSVASTLETWLDYKNSCLASVSTNVGYVWDIISSHTPDTEHLQIKLIVLWFEELGINIEYVQDIV